MTLIISNDELGVSQVHAIIRELQQIAKDSGHERPLLIGIDQENGEDHFIILYYVEGWMRIGLVSAFSSTTMYVAGTQLYVPAMALAATGSTDIVEQVSQATGHEMKLGGISWAYRCVHLGSQW